MTRPDSVVAHALFLAALGWDAKRISDAIKVPRRTIADWLAGRTPRRPPSKPRCLRCGASPHQFDALPESYAYLLGLYLGDGCISSHPRGVFKLRINLDARYPHIVDQAAAAVREVMPQNRVAQYVRPYGDVEVYSYSKSWPCLLPQHGLGRKHERGIQLTAWQDACVAKSAHLLLRGLLHSDGCRFVNRGRNWTYHRYSFRNRSADILQIFRLACDLTGIRCTQGKDVAYISRKQDVDFVDKLVGPKA